MKTRQYSIEICASLLMFAAAVFINESRVHAAPAMESANAEIRQEEPRARMSDEQVRQQTDARATLQKATDLYAAIVKGKHGDVPESVLVKAQCIAVIPDVISGALIVGGSHGAGVASCKENSAWSAPAFIKMNSVSFGAQVGGKSTDLVLFMISDKAKAALKTGKITLGTDVSVTAGTFNRALDTSTQGVIAYNRTEGVFAGAALSGGTISSADSDTAAYYGKDLALADILNGGASTGANSSAERFTTLLPR